MPPVEETLASYLSMGKTASLKVPSLPSKPLQDTSRLNGKAYAAAGQAVASLHTMAVLQAYQADLPKDLDDGQGLSPDEVAELHRTTDLQICSFPLILRNKFSTPHSSVIGCSPVGQASLAPLTIEGHL